MNQNLSDITSTYVPSGRRSRTRVALCTALLSLLEKKSLDQITVKELTTLAGVGYATFFRNYEDKEALLHDLAANEIQKLLAMTLPIFYSVDSAASTQALCAYVWEHRMLWSALLTGGAAAIMKEEYLNQALRLMAERPNPELCLPVDLAVTFSVTSTVEILAWWLKQDKPPSTKQLAETLNRLSVAPLFERR